VKVINVQPAPITRSIALTGTIAAEEQVVLAVKVTGRISDITVELG
jgi:multidrug efflux pump subunit AcrA (membrane-fusion protein)